MEFNDLTEEQKAKAMACTSAEELLALAQEEDLDLTDEQLNGIAVKPIAPHTHRSLAILFYLRTLASSTAKAVLESRWRYSDGRC